MKVIAFLNAYSSGKSGGDIRAIEILKRRPSGAELLVVTSALGKSLCEEERLSAGFLVTTSEEAVGNIPLLYLARIILGLKLACGRDFKALGAGAVIYSTSDALPDVLPALVVLARNAGARWFCPVYHLITPMSKRPGGYSLDNILSYFSQKISLFLIKRFGAEIDTETSFNQDKLAEDYGVAKGRVLVVPSGINLAPVDAVPAPPETKYDFCYLARIHRSKGVFDLVQAWKRVCAQRPQAKLGIGGGGADEALLELKELVKELSLEPNIDLLGFLSEEDKYKLFKSSRAYVLPSYEEGIPITFYEAMYAGLPVVTYYLPTYCDIKDNVLGVRVGDVAQLAEVLASVLEKGEEVGAQVAVNKRLVEENNAWEGVAERFWLRLDGR